MKRFAEAEYRIPYRLSGVRPGAHRGSRAGAGYWFLGVVDFLQHPDARRLDVRRSLLNPFAQLQVKVFEQRLAATVVIAADLSASMAAVAEQPKVVWALTQAVAASARRLGDRFGFCGFDTQVRRELAMPPLASTSWVREFGARLSKHPWSGRGAQGVLSLPGWLPVRRSLVFLVSDFHWPEELIRQALRRLKSHWIVPVVLWRLEEFQGWPKLGLRQVIDAETQQKRLVVLSPGWHRRLKAGLEARRKLLNRLFQAEGLRPLWLSTYDPKAIRRYFQSLPC